MPVKSYKNNGDISFQANQLNAENIQDTPEIAF